MFPRLLLARAQQRKRLRGEGIMTPERVLCGDGKMNNARWRWLRDYHEFEDTRWRDRRSYMHALSQMCVCFTCGVRCGHNPDCAEGRARLMGCSVGSGSGSASGSTSAAAVEDDLLRISKEWEGTLL